MKKAVVTGASSGIGLAIAKRLLAMGYEVIGISRSITQESIPHANFKALQVDLCDAQALLLAFGALENISLLINAAGFGRFDPHETLAPKTITQMVALNLTAPILLANALLRELKKNEGYIFHITSIEALRSSRFAALYSATKSGLKAFGDALFEETRGSGVKIVNIHPDMTETNFFKELRFDVTQESNQKLFAEDIADAIEHILKLREGVVVTNYTVRSSHFGITKRPKT